MEQQWIKKEKKLGRVDPPPLNVRGLQLLFQLSNKVDSDMQQLELWLAQNQDMLMHIVFGMTTNYSITQHSIYIKNNDNISMA